MTRSVFIFLFDDAEVLDFAGPFEVFSTTEPRRDPPPFRVRFVAERDRPVVARSGFRVLPHLTLDQPEAQRADIILIPGGGGYRADGSPYGTRREMLNPRAIEWIQRMHQQTELTLSVCTGALLFAKAGLLEHQPATTHHGAFDLLASLSPTTRVVRDRRFVEAGKIITSAGVSAGIDMALHVVARLLAPEVARRTAAEMEYPCPHL